MNSGSALGYFFQVVPITCVVGMLYAVARAIWLRQNRSRIMRLNELVKLAFVCYLTGLCNLVLLPENFWLNVFDGIFFGCKNEFQVHMGTINLVPVVVKWLDGEYEMGVWVTEMLVGNMLMFMPLGFFLPVLTQKVTKRDILVFAVVVPLTVELIQMGIGRSFDLDDLICNFWGMMIGFALGHALKRLMLMST